MVARAMPTVSMNSPMRAFCSANTCSTDDRTFDRARLARRCASGMGCPFGFLKCTIDRRPAERIAASLTFER